MDTFQVGEVIAERYRIERHLGHGGMGVVFLVEDMRTSTKAALKTLHPKYLENEQALARFAREVNASHRLDHPGIVKIFDARHWNGTLFYVMEYIDGKSLRHWLRQRGRLQLGSAVRVLCLVADALDHAHQITVHRDLSPENIMVMSDGSVRILDFGLAKLDDRYKGLTMAGAQLGKIDYVAPEQQLNAAQVDCRADIYPLGAIFFEMLTGKRPKYGARLTDLFPELPLEADAFLAKAMAADPDKRFQTAAEFREELLRVYKIAQGELPSTLRKRRKFWMSAVPFITRIRLWPLANMKTEMATEGRLSRISDMLPSFWKRKVG